MAEDRLLTATAVLLGLLYFFIPAGRFEGTIFGISFSTGYDAFKMVPLPFAAWLSWRWKQRRPLCPESKLMLPFVCLLMISIVAGMGSPNGWQALADSLEILFYLGFLILLLDIPWTPRLLYLVAGGFVVGNLYLGSVVAQQYWSTRNAQEIVRLSGTYDHPNPLGVYTILGFTLLLWLSHTSKNKAFLFWTWIAAAALLFANLMTQSRTALLALAAWGITAAWIGSARMRKWICAFSVTILLAMILLTPQSFVRLSRIGEEAPDPNRINRPLIWQQYLTHELPGLSPFGVGMGPVATFRFGDWIGSHPIDSAISRAWGPHNTYLAWMLGAGLLGLFALVWLMKTAWDQIQRCEPFTRSVLSAGFVSFAVACLFQDPFLHGNLPLAWITLAAIGDKFSCENKAEASS